MAVSLRFFPTSGSSTGSGSFTSTVNPDKGVIKWFESVTKTSGSSYLSASSQGTNSVVVTCGTSTAGTYTASFEVVARVEESGGYQSNAYGTLSVTYTVEASVITVDAPTFKSAPTYSGSQINVGSSTYWNNWSTTYFTASGVTGTNAGSYTATFTCKSGYTFSSGTSTTVGWSISKLSLTKPSLSPWQFTYTGSSQSPTENNYNSTYETRSSSSTTSATNVGKYYYYWTLDSTSNTQWSDGSTSQHSDYWEITKGTNTVTFTTTSASINFGSTMTRTGSATWGTVSYSSSNESVATVTKAGIITGVGAGTATITCTSSSSTNYNSASKSFSLTVNKVAAVKTNPSAKSGLTYNGSSQTLYNEGSSSDGTFSVTNGTRTSAGSQTVSWTFTPDGNHTVSTSEASGSFTASIAKATAVKTNPTGKTNLVYNSNSQQLYNDGSSSHGTFTVSGGSASSAGSHTVSWTFAPDSNHTTTDASGSFSVSIAKASVTYKPDDVTIYPGQSFTQGYTKVSGDTYPGDTPISNIMYSYDGRSSADIPRQKGTYDIEIVTYTANDNYAITTQKGTLTVTAIRLTIPTLSGSYTYNGSNQTVSVTGYDSSLMTQSGNPTAKNASTYTVSWALKDTAQYEWSDGTTSTKSGQWTIGKKDLTLSWGTASWIYDGSTHSTTCSASGTVASEIVGVELGNNFVGPTVGYTDVEFVEFTGAYKDNYQLESTESTTKRITITAKPITLTWGTLSWVYDGSSHSTTCTVTEKVGSDDVTVSLEGNSVGPNVSSATVTARGLLGTDARNYTISSSAVTSQTLSITKAPGSWTTKPTGRTSTYDGTAKPLCYAGTTSTGTPMYRSETGSYSTSIPTDTEADNAFNNHRVYFYVKGDGNHNDTDEESVLGEILKADQYWTLTSTIALSGLTPTGNISISGTTYGTISTSTSEYYTAGTWSNNTCKITAVKATPTGGVNITVTAPGDSNHNSLSRTCACTITRSKTTITFDASSPSNVDVGQRTVDPIVATTNATDVHLMYRSADTNIAIMVSGAHVEGIHAGQTEIIAYHEQTGLWEAGKAGWDFIVEKVSQTLTFQYNSIRLDLPAFSFSNAITSATYGEITATSSNTSAVRIQSQNDPITGTWAGQTNTTVTVSVTVAGDRDHLPAFGSFTVIVGGGGGGNAHPCAIYEWNGSRWVELIPYVWTGTAWAQAMSVTYD